MEKGGERWSKPHVATLSLHSLMELKMCIEKGTIMLDLEASTLPQVVGEYARIVEPLGLPSKPLPPSPPYRDHHRQPHRERSAESGPEGKGHVHAATEASPPNQEVQPALARRHRQECVQRQQAVLQPRER